MKKILAKLEILGIQSEKKKKKKTPAQFFPVNFVRFIRTHFVRLSINVKIII